MEDLVQVIIYILIAISIFSSFFKKKEAPPPPPSARKPQYDDEVQDYEPEVKESRYGQDQDILAEIEGLFRGETKPPADEIPDYEKPLPAPAPMDYRKPERPPLEKYDEKTRDISWQSPVQSEHMMSEAWEKKRKEIAAKADAQILARAEKFEKLLSSKGTVHSESVRRVKARLEHPETLKEFIVMTAILGKPKALDR